MTVKQILQELEALGSDQTRRIYRSHGAKNPLYGVKIGDMKKLLRKTGTLREEALELWDSGNADARYFAALAVEADFMSRTNLRKWARQADWHMLSEYGVAQLISESPHGWTLGIEFIESLKENVACCGWATLGSWLSFRPDKEIEVDQVKALLAKLESTIESKPNRLRFTMCNFVVAAGAFVPEMTKVCLAICKRLRNLEIEPVKKGCSVPEIVEDLSKIQTMGRIGKKRKRGRC
ncbi:MAG: DNA alkylation repair protein [Verrucomicrobiae bacterium]|nr:DNA alkylation repair protein [Verrucomicrobiae bacterium]